ncbi:MAG: hypothetical protein VW405_17120, partial [Rhodospirillaceae bacterium]
MRDLNTVALDGYALSFAGWWLQGKHPSKTLGPLGRDGLEKELYNLTYKDEYEYLIDAIAANLGGSGKESFLYAIDRLKAREARSSETLDRLLKEKLAVDRHGNHLNGFRGTTKVGVRWVGMAAYEQETLWSVRRRKMLGLPLHAPDRTDRQTTMVIAPVKWHIYAGEAIERAAIAAGERDFVQEGLSLIDAFPGSSAVMVEDTNIANVAAIAMADALVDLLDVGATAATIRGRTGTQPANVDAAETGTLLFTLTCSDPAFGGAADANPGGIATAS